VSPAILDQYAGAYLNEELNLLFGLEVRGEALVIIPPEQGDVRLAPDEKDHFISGARAFPMIVFQGTIKSA
jgi:hypothetical protein